MSPFPRLKRSATKSSEITLSSPKPSSLSFSSSVSRQSDQKMSCGRGGAGNINNEDEEGSNLPVTTIANSSQEDNERFGVGRGGTGNYKRPPAASRYLHNPRGNSSQSNASHGSIASRRRQSNVSGAGPYSPSRPSMGSFATGRSIQPIPDTTVHLVNEATMPSSAAMAQFQFGFSGSGSDHEGNIERRSRSPSRRSDLEPQKVSERYQDHQNEQYQHPLQTASTINSANNIRQNVTLTSGISAPAATVRKLTPAIVSNVPAMELTALPQVQSAIPPSSIPIPIHSPCSSDSQVDSPPSAIVPSAQATHPPDPITKEEIFVYGRGGIANISKESDGSSRQHRTLVDYLASKRNKKSDSAKGRNNDHGHDSSNGNSFETKKKGWWRKGKQSHRHLNISNAVSPGPELQPLQVTAE